METERCKPFGVGQSIFQDSAQLPNVDWIMISLLQTISTPSSWADLPKAHSLYFVVCLTPDSRENLPVMVGQVDKMHCFHYPPRHLTFVHFPQLPYNCQKGFTATSLGMSNLVQFPCSHDRVPLTSWAYSGTQWFPPVNDHSV